jgi:hypothetical protein
MLRELLGSIVILYSQLSVESLSELFHTTKQQIDRTLKSLHAIIDIPNDQTRSFRLHHPSFRDFLLNNDRCKDPMKQDICGLNTSGILATNVESSRVDKYLPSEVQYTCIYWIQHLQKSSAQFRDNDQVHQFL